MTKGEISGWGVVILSNENVEVLVLKVSLNQRQNSFGILNTWNEVIEERASDGKTSPEFLEEESRALITAQENLQREIWIKWR